MPRGWCCDAERFGEGAIWTILSRDHRAAPEEARMNDHQKPATFIAAARAEDQTLLPPCCRSWAYDPVTHGPSPSTRSGHHPACPNGLGHEMIPPDEFAAE